MRMRNERLAPRRALLVSGTLKGQEQLKALLEESDFQPGALAGSGGEARRALFSTGTDLVVVNAPLPDEFGCELACDAAEKGLGVMLLVKAELLEETRARVSPFGAVALGKPFSRERFHEALSLLAVFLDRLEKAEQKSRKLAAKLEEVKTVCRAKCLLVEFRHLTEPEAHRYIEKEAMDRQLTRWAVAEELLEELGNG